MINIVQIRQFAKDVKIKIIYGFESELKKWLSENPLVFIIDIEYFRYEDKLGTNHIRGYHIYYDSSKSR